MTRRPVLLVLCALLAGCLEREERLVVTPDGAVEVVHVVRGDPADLDGGAARQPGPGAWAVERTTRTREDGTTEAVLEARGRFASVAALPGSFGPADEPAGAGGPAFTTELWVRTEPDGRTRYTFLRRYAPRAWGDARRAWERAFPREVLELAGRPYPELAEGERRRLVGAVLEWEASKAAGWIEAAVDASGAEPERRAAARLAGRGAVLACYREVLDFEEVDALLRGQAGARIEQRAREVQEAVTARAVEAAAAALGLARPDALHAGYERQRLAFEVSEDLGDEQFVVRVRLPGRLEAHDGDAVEGGEVVWRFGGQDLRDREQVLVATSVSE